MKSLRRRRYEASLGAFALALGVALILLAFPPQSGLISPGPLTPMHAAASQQCAACHAVDNSNPTSWLRNELVKPLRSVQSDKCLSCHRELGPDALNPHSADEERIAQLSDAARQNHPASTGDLMTELARATFGSNMPGRQIECASCHKEHHGADFDLKQLSDQQCQVCHTQAFHSFASGHPEFTDYPVSRRTRIHFDHTSHYGRHFASSSTATTAIACSQCHQAEGPDQRMTIGGYESSCASCHDSQITEDVAPGLLVFAIPRLDAERLRASGLEPGLWPEPHPRHAAAKSHLPGLAQLLLARSREFPGIESRIHHLNLADLRGASPDELQAVHDFAWLFKERLHQMCFEDSAVDEIAANALPAETFALQQRSDALLSLIPTAVRYELCSLWFAHLETELNSRKTGSGFEFTEPIELRSLSQIVNDQNRIARTIQTGWYLQASDLSLRYRPVGHADPIMRRIMEIMSSPLADGAGLSVPEGNDFELRLTRELWTETTSFTPGRCAKCHTLDRSPEATGFNWLSFHPDPIQKSFTRFDHAPHLIESTNASNTNAQCQACHQWKNLDAQAALDMAASFAAPEGHLATDASHFVHQFEPIRQQSCSQCHQKGAAGNSCLDCHSYHVHEVF